MFNRCRKTRPRAIILEIGKAIRHTDGTWFVDGWHFDGTNSTSKAPFKMFNHPEIGWHSFGGYSIDDLVSISAQEKK